MIVIPSINCDDGACVRNRLDTLKKFLAPGAYVHLDVTDGVWSTHKTWGDPMVWTSLASPFPLEVHLMVEFPLEYAEDWLAAGARRLIVHVETLEDGVLHGLRQMAELHKGELVLASRPETAVDEIEKYTSQFEKFLVLAVPPGAAGQTFMPSVLDTIKFLRELKPDGTIEVDGGMNPETARLARSAGADTAVSAHYIFNHKDPAQAFTTLMEI